MTATMATGMTTYTIINTTHTTNTTLVSTNPQATEYARIAMAGKAGARDTRCLELLVFFFSLFYYTNVCIRLILSNSNSRGSRRNTSRAVGMFFLFFSLFYCIHLILGSFSICVGLAMAGTAEARDVTRLELLVYFFVLFFISLY